MGFARSFSEFSRLIARSNLHLLRSIAKFISWGEKNSDHQSFDINEMTFRSNTILKLLVLPDNFPEPSSQEKKMRIENRFFVRTPLATSQYALLAVLYQTTKGSPIRLGGTLFTTTKASWRGNFAEFIDTRLIEIHAFLLSQNQEKPKYVSADNPHKIVLISIKR